MKSKEKSPLTNVLDTFVLSTRKSWRRKTQPALKAASHLIVLERKFDSIFTIQLNQLHWLPIRKQIDYIELIIFKSLHHSAPDYQLCKSFSSIPVCGRLSSAAYGGLQIPSTSTLEAASEPKTHCSCRREAVIHPCLLKVIEKMRRDCRRRIRQHFTYV